MKKFILSILAIAAMTSCTKTSEDDVDPNAPVEIKLNAGIETSISIGRSAVNNLMKQHLEILFSLKGMEIKPEQILRGVTPPLIQRFLQTEQLLSIQFYIIIKILQNTLISLGCIPNPPGQ